MGLFTFPPAGADAQGLGKSEQSVALIPGRQPPRQQKKTSRDRLFRSRTGRQIHQGDTMDTRNGGEHQRHIDTCSCNHILTPSCNDDQIK
jgi:hypothetical protein